MAAKKPKEIVPIPPDRFLNMPAGDRLMHLEELGREAMLGKAKWIERTGALGKQVERYKAATSQSARRGILREMGQQIQDSFARRTAKTKMSVGDAYRAAKAGGSTGSGSGGGGPRGAEKDVSTE